MDSIFDYIIFLIPLAIFIGRTVLQLRNKHGDKKGKPAPAPVFVGEDNKSHWEMMFADPETAQDDDDVPHWERVPADPEIIPDANQKKAKKTALTTETVHATIVPLQANENRQLVSNGTAANKAAFKLEQIQAELSQSQELRCLTSTGLKGKSNFSFNLNYLSPLKQAVVMAEILGIPKGFRNE